ncbi:MAG: type III pantothenate kinase [Bacillota bacterium]|nr:type III pantothenate kinase [Bacillota bacterium]
MVFVMDVGNMNIKCGLFKNKALSASWRVSADRIRTADEYGMLIMQFFQYGQYDMDEVEGIIISSVIPSLNYTLEHMCQMYFKKEALFVGPGIKTGMNIRYENPKDLGPDRLATAIGAYDIYKLPCIVVDFGTATTFSCVDAGGDFLGGAICPGVKISADALVSQTARLPKIELFKPPRVIARNTVGGMQSGIIFGYAGMVDTMIERMREEMGESEAKAVATGGMANLISSETKNIEAVESRLSLFGLRILYERNR